MSSSSLKYTALSSLWSIACRSSWDFCQAEEVPHHHTQGGQAAEDFLYIYPIPPHSASCTSASRVCVPVAGGKNTISTSCSRCLPPRVQVENLHQLMEGEQHQRKVQWLGPASGQVGAGCSNNMQLQPPPPPTRSRPARAVLECPMQQSLQLAYIRAQSFTLYTHLYKLYSLLHQVLDPIPLWLVQIWPVVVVYIRAYTCAQLQMWQIPILHNNILATVQVTFFNSIL